MWRGWVLGVQTLSRQSVLILPDWPSPRRRETPQASAEQVAGRVSQGRLRERATVQGKDQLSAQAFHDEYLELLESPRNPKVLIDKVCDLSVPRASPEKAKSTGPTGRAPSPGRGCPHRGRATLSAPRCRGWGVGTGKTTPLQPGGATGSAMASDASHGGYG